MTHGHTNIAAPALQVLVVDDSQAQRTHVRSALERAGLTVVGEAEDGAQALTQAAANHPDVVLMDLCMPRMDGVQATRILRRQQPGTPVVLWTGVDEAQLERAVCTSGAQVGIPKGIGTVELVTTLREAFAAQHEGPPVAGDRCLWHVGGTAGENGPVRTKVLTPTGDGSRSQEGEGPSSVTTAS